MSEKLKTIPSPVPVPLAYIGFSEQEKKIMQFFDGRAQAELCAAFHVQSLGKPNSAAAPLFQDNDFDCDPF